jgi:outer membrane protein OmpA-like peptidoglycan-associated protein
MVVPYFIAGKVKKFTKLRVVSIICNKVPVRPSFIVLSKSTHEFLVMGKSIFLYLLFCFIGFFTASGQAGLLGEYYDGRDFKTKVMTRIDPNIHFRWDINAPPANGMDPGNFSVRWTGRIKAPKTGKYLFNAVVDDGIRVKVGGKTVIDAWTMNDDVKYNGTIALTAGQTYDFQVEYFNGLFEGEVHLQWQLPGEEPLFGGLFGTNEKLIGAEHFSQPEKTPAQPPPPAIRNKPQVAKNDKKPAAKNPVEKPAAKKDVPAAKTKTVHKDTLEKYIPKNVHFVKSKSELLPESFPELDRLAGFLQRNPALKLSIEGHTDDVGNAAKNLELSEQRAHRVASYLSDKGVAPARIRAKGYGGTRPLVKGAGNTGSSVNRRVEFLIGS